MGKMKIGKDTKEKQYQEDLKIIKIHSERFMNSQIGIQTGSIVENLRDFEIGFILGKVDIYGKDYLSGTGTEVSEDPTYIVVVIDHESDVRDKLGNSKKLRTRYLKESSLKLMETGPRPGNNDLENFCNNQCIQECSKECLLWKYRKHQS